MEETGKKLKNGWLSKYFPLQEAVILKTNETTAKYAEYKYFTIVSCIAVYMLFPSWEVKPETAMAAWEK